MKLSLENGRHIDTTLPIDLSIGVNESLGIQAWYVQRPVFEPVRENGFLGSVAEGGNVNFRNIRFNPHGHCTHTECLGHITPEVYSVQNAVRQFFSIAQVVSVLPEDVWNEQHQQMDKVIQCRNIVLDTLSSDVKSLIIRTLPNGTEKLSRNYSDTNPPYLDLDVIALLDEWGIQHLLLDLPSVDREVDGGVLAFHHAFWKVPSHPDFHRTITECVFVPDEVEDGKYVLELQVAPFENDAAPSRPVLYRMS